MPIIIFNNRNKPLPKSTFLIVSIKIYIWKNICSLHKYQIYATKYAQSY